MSEAVKSTVRTGEPGSDGQKRARATDAMSRIKLALLEQYSREAEKTGADPYNTTGGSSPAQDAWRGNARRI